MARALYIHWPFCAKKCPYCDFNSHVREQVDIATWQNALIADMRAEAQATGGAALTSIFFGGGTPSLMPPSLVEALLAEAASLWGFAPDVEITLEANPSSVEASAFADLAAAGINRVSLGIQSFNDDRLRWLGRLHSAEEAKAALCVAQKHFGRVSFDLIYALPGQTLAEWEHELGAALAVGTGHLSLYQLTIEPGTRFASDVRRGIFSPMEDDAAAAFYTATQARTERAGLPAYETSNHARPGGGSRHNLAYWRYQDYAGIGPGAHGRRGGSATMRHRKPENYLAAVAARGHGIAEQRALASREQASEALLMGLRLVEGVDLAELESRFALTRDQLLQPNRAAHLETLGLIATAGSRITVRPEGRPLLDAILAEIVADDLVAA
jgi:oxygen-independent coproporphyrinogen-3 oxidase